MSAEEWQVVWFTAWVAALSTIVILPFGLGVAWLLARHDWPGKSLVETVITLPLVMPPVATGLILLEFFGNHGVGGFIQKYFGFRIIFTWRAVLLALCVMSFPLLVRSARMAFEEVNPRLEQIARTLGAGNLRVFLTISVPLARRGIVGGMLLAFARALGEFGATIMVAGNIAGPHANGVAGHLPIGAGFSGRGSLSVAGCLSGAGVYGGVGQRMGDEQEESLKWLSC